MIDTDRSERLTRVVLYCTMYCSIPTEVGAKAVRCSPIRLRADLSTYVRMMREGRKRDEGGDRWRV